MRQIISTAIVAVVVGAVAGATMGAVAQTEPEAATPQAIVPSVSSINAHKVDGRHAVSAGASKAKRAGKLVATNKQGYLPSNIVKPKWSLIRGKPAVLADGKIRWNEVLGKPAGFADGADDAGVTGITITKMSGPFKPLAGDTTGWAYAECPPGSTVIGGGFWATAWDFHVVVSTRGSNNDWQVAAWNKSGSSADFQAIAFCMSAQPVGTISTASKGAKPAGLKMRK